MLDYSLDPKKQIYIYIYIRKNVGFKHENLARSFSIDTIIEWSCLIFQRITRTNQFKATS